MRIRFNGVRGSTPAPGGEFVRVGGNTSCVAVTAEGSDRPHLLLDAGTGIRAVTADLVGRPFEGTILLTHLHWDHFQGLPFFAAGDRADATVELLLPDEGVDATAQLRRAMSPPHFPIGPEGLQGHWRFDVLDAGRSLIEGLRVTAAEVPHKGGRTFGYRLADDVGSMAYVPDHLPSEDGPGRMRVLDLIAGVDLLVHDAQFTASEAELAATYGHATIEQAVRLALDGGVAELVLFHHSPARTDDQIDELVTSMPPVPCRVSVAREGATRHVVGPV